MKTGCREKASQPDREGGERELRDGNGGGMVVMVVGWGGELRYVMISNERLTKAWELHSGAGKLM